MPLLLSQPSLSNQDRTLANQVLEAIQEGRLRRLRIVD